MKHILDCMLITQDCEVFNQVTPFSSKRALPIHFSSPDRARHALLALVHTRQNSCFWGFFAQHLPSLNRKSQVVLYLLYLLHTAWVLCGFRWSLKRPWSAMISWFVLHVPTGYLFFARFLSSHFIPMVLFPGAFSSSLCGFSVSFIVSPLFC